MILDKLLRTYTMIETATDALGAEPKVDPYMDGTNDHFSSMRRACWLTLRVGLALVTFSVVIPLVKVDATMAAANAERTGMALVASALAAQAGHKFGEGFIRRHSQE